MSTSPAQTGYAPVNGLNMYYEIYRSGSPLVEVPLVLLHGSMTTIYGTFRNFLPSLAETWQVIAVEQQAHGHTGDIDRPLTFEGMADDTVALLRHLKIEKADFFGYSGGANVALQTAIRHPDLVRKLVVASAFFRRDGYYPEVLEGLKQITAEALPPIMRAEYERIAPKPEDWPVNGCQGKAAGAGV